MKTIKVSETDGVILDFLVAKCVAASNGKSYVVTPRGKLFINDPTRNKSKQLHWYSPSTDPYQAYPIIDKENISTFFMHTTERWKASMYIQDGDTVFWGATGNTPLLAAMRCYVISKLGEEVEVSEEL